MVCAGKMEGGYLRDRESLGFLRYLTVVQCSSSSSTTRGLGSEVFGFWREIREWEGSYKTPLIDTLNGHSHLTSTKSIH